jgi:mannose/cellobiose epimerase-like protein (N-acyl-D-glucosamine 2-epimerase family)
MHLFEAAIFLAAFSGRSEFTKLADELFELASLHLYDRTTGTLPEFFDVDWNPGDENGIIRVEPGHHYEWVWLLSRYGELRGTQQAFRIADDLFAFAQQYGHDPATGLIVDAVDVRGQVQQRDFRIWPNMEFLKAQVAMQERHGSGVGFDDEAIEANLGRITKYFLSPQCEGPAAALRSGLWIDYLDAETFMPKCDHVPASTLYHIMFGLAEYLRFRSGHASFSGMPW